MYKALAGNFFNKFYLNSGAGMILYQFLDLTQVLTHILLKYF